MTVAVRPMTGAERMLAASRWQPSDVTPAWFMRQAGRSLADYRQLREQYSILTLAKTPELCSRCRSSRWSPRSKSTRKPARNGPSRWVMRGVRLRRRR
jgi:Uroporphyrinogen decarboxylase (URO-D)